MGQYPAVTGAMVEAIESLRRPGAGGTRNISGTNHYHVLLERELADLHGKQAALLFTSGYVSNWAALGTLGVPILPDCVRVLGRRQPRLDDRGDPPEPGGEAHLSKHNDPADLDRQLSRYPSPGQAGGLRVGLLDGRRHRADRRASASVAEAHGALTYLDEVHAVGLYGPRGGGIAEREGPDGSADRDRGHARQGLRGDGRLHRGLVGALVDFVRSFASGFIFTTALPPAVAAGALASVRHLKHSTSRARRAIRSARPP